MGAETILVSGSTEILKKLISLITQEINLAWGVKDELKKLQSTVNMILAVIVDAEKRQVKEEAVRLWLKSLQDLAYEVDDILDIFSYELMRRDDQLKRKRDKVHNFFSSSNPLLFRFQMASKIKDINRKFDGIAEQKNRFHLLQVIDVGPSNPNPNPMIVDDVSRENRKTYSFVDESTIIGRKNDKKRILKMLMNPNGSDTHTRISVIPIVGMGGLGKTALAKLIYNAHSVEKHFDQRIWVCVSDQFDLQRLLRNMFESITGTNCDDVSSKEVLVRRLHEKLSRRKYFLVLDDMWNEKHEDWMELKELLAVGDKRSKIVVTTRSNKVASIVKGNLPPYELQKLSNDECWSVFQRNAFEIGEVVNPNLVEIGREMVKKCKGLPLAAMVLGGVMHSKKVEHEWLSIRNNAIWDTLDDQNTILPVLKLSYDHLPSHLKPCFTYCAIFPKDFYFDKETLIQFWMAEGFLQPSIGKNKKAMVMEDTGNEYFNVLLRNSFFQDVEKDNFGNVVGGKMHDLIHDLAQSVAGTYECSNRKSILMETGSGRKFRLWLEGDEDNSIVPEAFNTKQNLRTCFASGKSVDQSIVNNVFGAKCLRMLDLSWNSFEKLPPAVDKLKHLRYLNLSRSGLTTLPGSITILYNLQTLILYRCLYLEVLPSDIGGLKKLRYLDLSKTPIKVLPDSITALGDLQTLALQECYRLEEFPKEFYMLTNLRHLPLEGIKYQVMPRGLGRLTCLETLQQFCVLKDINGGCGIRELEHLNMLSGDLKILNLENVSDGIDAQRANLKGMSNIDKLILYWGRERSADGCDNDEVVLEGLQPHLNLKRLEIRGFMGEKFRTWLVSTTTTTRISQFLPNLVEIKLESCRRCEQLSGIGRLRSLKKLTLCRMAKLKEWEEEKEEEEEVSSTTATTNKQLLFPCLEKLDISECPDLRITPALFPSLKYLRVEKSNAMGVRSLVRRSTSLTFLTSLYMRDISKLKFLPLDLLQPKLQSLMILKCPKFKGFVKNEDEMCCFSDASSSYSYLLRERLTSLPKLRILCGEQFKGFLGALT